MFYFLPLVSLALAIAPAQAAEPAQPTEPTIQDDGTVYTSVFVAADVAAVKRAISDPVAAAALCPDIVSARIVQKGSCDLVEVRTRGMTSPLTYLVRRCPTADGYQEKMVSSEDFTDVRVDWKVEAVAGGSKVSYTIRTLPDVPVPQRIITSLTAKSAVTALKNLVHRVTGL